MREVGPTAVQDVVIKKTGTKQDGTPYKVYSVKSDLGTFDTYDEKLYDAARTALNRGQNVILTVSKKPDRSGRLWDVLTAVCLLNN
jgi:hypothetical protein